MKMSKNKQDKICLVGLGYVGLPLAIEFSKKYDMVVGFDISEKKINALKKGIDPTLEVGDDAVKGCTIKFTLDPSEIKRCNFIIVAVPTPIDDNNKPDLTPVIGATEIVGRNLAKGAIVVYESTVYPGVTEEICLPILEKLSKMKLGDFGLGYSPERVNPGDKLHTIDKIVKVVSGHDEKTLNKVADIYGSVIAAGIHKAPSIKVAEAAKVIENIQRDLNIALMNELSLIFDRMDINTHDVIEAASTKWNFHKYTPGLVGGHCIGVDPYYLTFRAQQLGYQPEVILAGRKINDSMHNHVITLAERGLKKAGKKLAGSKILVMGLTFKENVNDPRNSRAKQMIAELLKKKAIVFGYDPYLDRETIEGKFNAKHVGTIKKGEYDAVILFSPHEKMLSLVPKDTLLIDIKGALKLRSGNCISL